MRELCLASQKIQFFDIQITEPQKVEDFKLYQEAYRLQNTEVKFDQIENSIKGILVDNCKKSLQAFKEENRIPIKDEQGEDIVEDQAPLLVGDETGNRARSSRSSSSRRRRRSSPSSRRSSRSLS